ncbi:hypothetical protein N7522_013970 [Penicillium canescens]|nr:hypothetical protein N7522_013970 [Penicillium canescens]
MWDHRIAFATGLPHTMQDRDIDERRLEAVSRALASGIPGGAAPTSNQGPTMPFLAVMIDYDRIRSEVLSLLNKTAERVDTQHQLWEFLDYKLLCLHDKFQRLNIEAGRAETASWQQSGQALENLQTLLSVRINHARTRLRLPHMQTSGGVTTHQELARVATDCACGTISLCSKLIKETAAWMSIRSACDLFTFSALAAILLVVSKDPQTYGMRCRQSFHEAIEILEGSQNRPFAPGKLSFTLDQLRDISERINMPKHSSMPLQPQNDNNAILQATAILSSANHMDIPDYSSGTFDLLDLSEDLGWDRGTQS